MIDRAGRMSRRGPVLMVVAQAQDEAKRKQYAGGRGGAAPLPARARRTSRLRRGSR